MGIVTPFAKGSPNPGKGRPVGSRQKLGEAFLAALHADFMTYGVGVIEEVRIADPLGYLKIIARILPSQMQVDVSHLQELSDHDLHLLAKFVELQERQALPLLELVPEAPVPSPVAP
jgi:hypothetical protein